MLFVKKFANCLVFAVLLVVSGCGNLVYHRVQEGDTLYSIGFRYNQDYHKIAEWNGLQQPYDLTVGQRLRVAPPTKLMERIQRRQGQPSTTSSVPSSTTSVEVIPLPERQRSTSTSPGDRAAAPRWVLPASGKILKPYSDSNPGNKGVDIGGQLGEPVKAAAGGKVVYSGNGLINYGNLVIIKHDEHYLSAYGHNSKLRVGEGDRVVAGQQIADMGRSTDGTVMLHFEIRYDGRPVDPQRYIAALR